MIWNVVRRIGRAVKEIRESSLTKWLTKSSKAYAQAFSIVSQRWGRHLVHRNLLIAKIKNIGDGIQHFSRNKTPADVFADMQEWHGLYGRLILEKATETILRLRVVDETFLQCLGENTELNFFWWNKVIRLIFDMLTKTQRVPPQPFRKLATSHDEHSLPGFEHLFFDGNNV